MLCKCTRRASASCDLRELKAERRAKLRDDSSRVRSLDRRELSVNENEGQKVYSRELRVESVKFTAALHSESSYLD